MQQQGDIMLELIPFIAGLGVGGLLIVAPLPRWRWLALPVLCVPIGALASAVNGELATSLWPLFISLDALLVWAGAVLVLATEAVRSRAA